MRDVIAHRGPDEAGCTCDGQAALGHRRLSIVDLTTGQQPLSNEDGDDLGRLQRRDLQPRRHPARARGARPSVPHAVRHRDHRPRLRGVGRRLRRTASAACSRSRSGTAAGGACCSCATASASSRSIGRDSGDLLLFGSEIKAILASGLLAGRSRVCRRCRSSSARVRRPARRRCSTAFTSCRPGHRLVFEDGDVRISQYWDVPVGDDAEDRKHARRRRPSSSDLLTESVKLRLMSDVPLGVFLSGGLDSSAIAATMATLMGRPLETFSVAFEERAFSELKYARDGRRRDRRDARTKSSSTTRISSSALPRLVWHEDEPIAHPSSVPLYFVSALAKTARHGRADRRRQRRAARRLRALSAHRSGTGAPGRSTTTPCPSRCGPRLPSGWSRSCRRTLWRDMPGDRFSAIDRIRSRWCSTASLGPCWPSSGRSLVGRFATPSTPPRPTPRRSRISSGRRRRQHAARSAALRGHEDLSRRAADEAGPDEHGGVDREPRAVSRSQARGVRGDACPTSGSSRA